MPITLGPITGHTTTNSVKIWLRGETGAGGTKPVAAIDLYQNGQRVQSRYEPLTAEFDYCGVARFDGLEAGTRYEVRADCLHFPSDQAPAVGIAVGQAVATSPATHTGSFRTATDTARKIRFLFGSCRWQEPTFPMSFSMREGDIPFRSMARLHNRNPYDFLMLIGDQVYTDAMGFLRRRKTAESFFELYRDTFEKQHFRNITGKVPTYMILDDHEIEDDWSRNRMACGGEEDRERFNIAMRAYQAYQNLHNPDTDAAGDPDAQLWYSFDWGVFPFFVLDNMTRKWTRPEDSDASSKTTGQLEAPTMLGAVQMKALTDWLDQNKDAPKKFIVTPEPVFPDRKNRELADKWPAFDQERGHLLHHIRREQIQNVVLLGGAVHNTSFTRMTCDQDPMFRVDSLVSSPIYAIPMNFTNRGKMILDGRLNLPDGETGTPHTFRYKCAQDDFFSENSFMEVEVDADRETMIHATAYRRDGKVQREYKF